jgi:hypothetical protein
MKGAVTHTSEELLANIKKAARDNGKNKLLPKTEP